jgi:hypothetical protein
LLTQNIFDAAGPGDSQRMPYGRNRCKPGRFALIF